MRNQKWNQFNDEEIPETPKEARIFLDHAIKHLFNRSEASLGKTFDILIKAYGKTDAPAEEEAL